MLWLMDADSGGKVNMSDLFQFVFVFVFVIVFVFVFVSVKCFVMVI